MKKRFMVLVLGVTLLCAACGKNGGGVEAGSDSATGGPETQGVEVVDLEVPAAGGEQAETPKEAKPLRDVYTEISENVSLVSPMEPSDEFIYNYYGINVSSLEEYVFVQSEDATSAETIIMVKVSDEAEIAPMKESLTSLLEDKAYEMEDYLPDQYEIVKKAGVRTSGSYLWLVISASQEDIIGIIEKYL